MKLVRERDSLSSRHRTREEWAEEMCVKFMEMLMFRIELDQEMTKGSQNRSHVVDTGYNRGKFRHKKTTIYLPNFHLWKMF